MRFFNQSEATADFDHWAKATYWSLEEAVALLFGKEPKIVSWEKLKSYQEKSPFVNDYRKFRDLARRASASGLLQDPGSPGIFLSWARRIDHEPPAALVEASDKYGYLTLDWYDHYQNLKERYDELESTIQNQSEVSHEFEEVPGQLKQSLGKYWTELEDKALGAVREFPAWSKSVRQVQKSGNLNDWLKQNFDLNDREAYIVQKALTEQFDQLK